MVQFAALPRGCVWVRLGHMKGLKDTLKPVLRGAIESFPRMLSRMSFQVLTIDVLTPEN